MRHERLVDQLPRVMAEDPFLRRFFRVFEDISTSVDDRIDHLDDYLDVGLAPIEMVRWLGGWLGVRVDPSLPEDRQRDVVRVAGQLLGCRGTRRWLEELLAALTGARVEVQDRGGVFAAGEAPSLDAYIDIHLAQDGGLGEERLRAFVATEVPVHATVRIRITDPSPRADGSQPTDPHDAQADAEEVDVADGGEVDDDGFLPPFTGGGGGTDSGGW